MGRIKKTGLVVLSLAASLLTFEVLLAFVQKQLVDKHCQMFGITEHRSEAAQRMGVKVSVNGRWYQALGLKAPPNHAIGTWTNAQVIGFKEGDGSNWPVHATDRFGFFNCNSWWDDNPELLIMGDSFVTCEHMQTLSLTGLIRERGIKAVNIGLTGSGPLLQLAALKAQWRHISNSVRTVVWLLYDGNDYQDAAEESATPEYMLALRDDYHIDPDQSLLAGLGENDDHNLFGPMYFARSILSLKRTRLVWRAVTGIDSGVPVWNEAISQAEKFTMSRVIIIRIPKHGYDRSRQWQQIVGHKGGTVPDNPELFSGGSVLSHLNKKGYTELGNMIYGCVYE